VRLENIVRYVGDAAAASVLVVCMWPILRWRRPSTRPMLPLLLWLLVAMLTSGVLLDLVRWRLSGLTIHFVIHCAALSGVLALAMRGPGKRRAHHDAQPV
jgi:hypothetical protein